MGNTRVLCMANGGSWEEQRRWWGGWGGQDARGSCTCPAGGTCCPSAPPPPPADHLLRGAGGVPARADAVPLWRAQLHARPVPRHLRQLPGHPGPAVCGGGPVRGGQEGWAAPGPGAYEAAGSCRWGASGRAHGVGTSGAAAGPPLQAQQPSGSQTQVMRAAAAVLHLCPSPVPQSGWSPCSHRGGAQHPWLLPLGRC